MRALSPTAAGRNRRHTGRQTTEVDPRHQRANDTEYGPSRAVSSRDVERAVRFGLRVDARGLTTDHWITVQPERRTYAI